MTTLRIATRTSPLALWQAEFVAASLEKANVGLKTELVGMKTQGDKILDSPLAKIGGKGLFVKELEIGMLEDRADIAVHSMKDVPVELPDGLHLGCILARHDPRDAFVSLNYQTLADLPQKAIVGTSSLRRECQLAQSRPDLQIKSLRGNINSRLEKLKQGQYDAIILAASGLKRIGFEDQISSYLEPNQSLPAIGQGALGIECRIDDAKTHQYLAPLMDQDTWDCVIAERAMNARLEGGCQVPIAGYAELEEGGKIKMRGLVGSVDGSRILTANVLGERKNAAQLGLELADLLLDQGAKELLALV